MEVDKMMDKVYNFLCHRVRDFAFLCEAIHNLLACGQKSASHIPILCDRITGVRSGLLC